MTTGDGMQGKRVRTPAPVRYSRYARNIGVISLKRHRETKDDHRSVESMMCKLPFYL